MFRVSLSPILRSTKQRQLPHLVTVTPYCCLLISWKSRNWYFVSLYIIQWATDLIALMQCYFKHNLSPLPNIYWQIKVEPKYYSHLKYFFLCYFEFVKDGIIASIFFYIKSNQMHNISNLFYFWNNTLRVSDSLSIHHQESKTVHTASGIRHTCSVATC